MLNFFNEDVSKPDLDFERIEHWLNLAITKNNFIFGALNFIFCSDEYLLKINNEYLNHDYYTDVITFNYNEANIVSGDIFISTERVKENALEFNISEKEELCRVIIHGVLHLVGFDDKVKGDKEKMTREENEYLKDFFDVNKL
ncbi:MAG TPA: rRNA maturation RNase YbeY [Marinilabiliales bacterium]|jgi:rRNA maturation RNase YbeY|nr:MAG: rRNA maturation RNase YbeY [Bacteroidetes bacterium GWC2_40_13]HBO75161.1 rRNA maturation RNase YbeY [Marinilabiliales bacterium]